VLNAKIWIPAMFLVCICEFPIFIATGTTLHQQRLFFSP